jgi:hypothetical protein
MSISSGMYVSGCSSRAQQLGEVLRTHVTELA